MRNGSTRRRSPPTEQDRKWVREFAEASSFGHYYPHITLGQAKPQQQPYEQAFTASRLALCHLGRTCTCRKILAEAELTGKG